MSEQTVANRLPVPTHVGVIMDGNGRWALRSGLMRTDGHLEGLKAAKRVVRAASNLGIKYISLYTFSTENWNRSPWEVKMLMDLLSKYIRREYQFYRKHNIRVLHSGNLEVMPPRVRRELRLVSDDTRDFTGMTINLAINYGGRDEIVRAVNRWQTDNQNGEITIDTLRRYLDIPILPDLDLIIRSGGEQRLSNFMLWECAYAELYFSNKLWPDWNEQDMEQAVNAYQQRARNFGGDRHIVS